MGETLWSLASLSSSPAHTLADADIFHLGSAAGETAAYRDRQVKLSELKSYMGIAGINTRVTDLETTAAVAAFEYLHKPDLTGNQLLITITDWFGSSDSGGVVYGTLKRGTDGIYTLDFLFRTPTAPASGSSGNTTATAVAGSGSGTTLWDAFLTQLAAEEAAGYGAPLATGSTAMGDFPPPVVRQADAAYPASPRLPSATWVIATPSTHTLQFGVSHIGGLVYKWSDFVAFSGAAYLRFTLSTRVPDADL